MDSGIGKAVAASLDATDDYQALALLMERDTDFFLLPQSCADSPPNKIRNFITNPPSFHNQEDG